MMWKKTLTLAVFSLALGLGACTDRTTRASAPLAADSSAAPPVLASAPWRAGGTGALIGGLAGSALVRVQATLRRRSDTVTSSAARRRDVSQERAKMRSYV